jgi:hypothetical protein
MVPSVLSALVITTEKLENVKTNYPGLDYAGKRSTTNRDVETGIRYGVISQASVNPEAVDDIFDHGTDVAYAQGLADHLATARANFVATAEEDEFDEDEATQEFADRYESDGGLNDYLYERDGYKLTGCLNYDLFVLKSPFFTYAQFCSPCVPGAGNLDSPFKSETNQESLDGTDYAKEADEAGFPRVYCLGHDWFENCAPYAIFSVATGKLVLANL